MEAVNSRWGDKVKATSSVDDELDGVVADRRQIFWERKRLWHFHHLERGLIELERARLGKFSRSLRLDLKMMKRIPAGGFRSAGTDTTFMGFVKTRPALPCKRAAAVAGIAATGGSLAFESKLACGSTGSIAWFRHGDGA